MTIDDTRTKVLRLAAERDNAQQIANDLGAEFRAAVREAAEETRPAEIARWLGVSPQYINKILHSTT